MTTQIANAELIRAVLDGKSLQKRFGPTSAWHLIPSPYEAIKAAMDDDGEYELRVAPEPHTSSWLLAWLGRDGVNTQDYETKEEAVEGAGNVACAVGINGSWELYRIEIDPETLAVTTIKEPKNA